MSKMNALKAWMQIATPEQQEDLATRAGTTRPYLYHLAGEFREATPVLAKYIEHASLEMHKETRGALPKVYRTDLNGACRQCDFAAKCLGGAIVAGEFPYLPSVAPAAEPRRVKVARNVKLGRGRKT